MGIASLVDHDDPFDPSTLKEFGVIELTYSFKDRIQTTLISDWCREQYGDRFAVGPGFAWFESQEDATLFQLKWM